MDECGVTCVNLEYAESAFVNLLPRAKSPALRKRAGKMSLDIRANAFTSIRNAAAAGKENVDIKKSKLLLEIVNILKKEGFIRDFREIDDKRQGLIRVYLKYGPDKRCMITGIKQVSKPGLRVYARRKEDVRVLRGYGISVLSTSRGVLTDREAKKLNVGGEVICRVW